MVLKLQCFNLVSLFANFNSFHSCYLLMGKDTLRRFGQRGPNRIGFDPRHLGAEKSALKRADKVLKDFATRLSRHFFQKGKPF